VLSIVALVGMGGIGKTTLREKMYHLFHNQYEKSSFFEDVKPKDINNVKEKLFHKWVRNLNPFHLRCRNKSSIHQKNQHFNGHVLHWPIGPSRANINMSSNG
jgi:GTPase SAR1 family protein